MDDPVEAAYSQALKLLARREHGRAELSRKLSQRGHPTECIAAALQRLEAKGHLSEARYAQARVTELRRRRYGPLRAQAELRAHGVAEEVITDAVRIDDSAWYRACEEACRRAARAAASTPAEQARLQRLLAGRGFTAAQIRAALGKNSSEIPDSDDA